jgi:hypothetical protein
MIIENILTSMSGEEYIIKHEDILGLRLSEILLSFHGQYK